MRVRVTQVGIFGAYYLMLAAYLAASFFPEYRLWGFNWWAYYPEWVRWTLFGAGALVPVVLRFTPQNHMPDVGGGSHPARAGQDPPQHAKGTLSPTTEEATSSDRKFFIYAGVIAASFGSLFYLLRARTHFLGDGYTLLSSLATDSPLAMKTREYGESLLHIVLKNMIGSDGQSAALASYQIISITAGLLFVVAVALFARKLYERTFERVLFLLGVCTGGYMLLFFGYVENYSLFVLSVLTYTLTGLLVAQGKTSRYWLLPPLIAAVFFHVLGVTLIPSALYLWIGPSRLGRSISGWRPSTKLVALLPIIIVAAIVFYHFYTTSYFFRFAFVPLFENRFTIEGYTLFSINHLVDFLNLLFLLVPGLLIVLVALSSRTVRRTLKPRPFIYLVVLIASVLGAVFIFDPKLGMPRDWDLFAFAGVPVAVLFYYLLLGSEKGRTTRRTAVLICFGLSLLCLFPRVLAQRSPEIAVNHLLSYRGLDNARCRNAGSVLAAYYRQTGEEWVEQIRQDHWVNTYVQEELFILGMDARNVGDHIAAINNFERACRIDPAFWNSWATMAACYGQLGLTDLALNALDIAEGLNPHGAAIFNNRGAVYTQLGKYREAERMFLKCLEIDTSSITPYLGLINVYRNTGQELLFRNYLFVATRRSDAPGVLLGELGKYMISKKQFPAAAKAYRLAMEKGLDSMHVQQVIQQYPQLGQQFK